MFKNRKIEKLKMIRLEEENKELNSHINKLLNSADGLIARCEKSIEFQQELYAKRLQHVLDILESDSQWKQKKITLERMLNDMILEYQLTEDEVINYEDVENEDD